MIMEKILLKILDRLNDINRLMVVIELQLAFLILFILAK